MNREGGSLLKVMCNIFKFLLSLIKKGPYLFQLLQLERNRQSLRQKNMT